MYVYICLVLSCKYICSLLKLVNSKNAAPSGTKNEQFPITALYKTWLVLV